MRLLEVFTDTSDFASREIVALTLLRIIQIRHFKPHFLPTSPSPLPVTPIHHHVRRPHNADRPRSLSFSPRYILIIAPQPVLRIHSRNPHRARRRPGTATTFERSERSASCPTPAFKFGIERVLDKESEWCYADAACWVRVGSAMSAVLNYMAATTLPRWRVGESGLAQG